MKEETKKKLKELGSRLLEVSAKTIVAEIIKKLLELLIGG